MCIRDRHQTASVFLADWGDHQYPCLPLQSLLSTSVTATKAKQHSLVRSVVHLAMHLQVIICSLSLLLWVLEWGDEPPGPVLMSLVLTMETTKIPFESGHFSMQHPKCGTVCPLLWENIAEKEAWRKTWREFDLFEPCTNDVYEENNIWGVAGAGWKHYEHAVTLLQNGCIICSLQITIIIIVIININSTTTSLHRLCALPLWLQRNPLDTAWSLHWST